MIDFLDPSFTYQILLLVQACHLLHHRIAKRHISFVEAIAAAVLCIQPSWFTYGLFLGILHLCLATIQVIGSVWIKRFSPE